MAREMGAFDGLARDVAAAEAYLRANVGRYRPADLDRQLRAAGHGEATIAEAWRRLSPYGSPIADRPPSLVAGVVSSFGVVLLGVAYGLLILVLTVGSLDALSHGDRGPAILGALPVVVLLTAWVLGTRRLTRLRTARAGLGATLVWLGILGGIWLVMMLVVAMPIR